MSSSRLHHVSLPDGFSVLAGPHPPDAIGFRSEHFQLLSNSSESWSDPAPHLHTDSDEMFMVTTGTVVFDVEGQEVAVSAGEICGFPAGLVHSVIRVVPPVHFFVLRAPALRDKEYVVTSPDAISPSP
jgi:mannose-6-phosphate isomerase-like protein (cupin superfamily)